MENAETRVIQLGHAPSTHTGDEDLKCIQTGSGRRSRKQIILERDDDEYR